MKKTQFYSFICLLSFSSLAIADEQNSINKSNVPNSSMFIGIGGSYNSVKVDQDLSGYGISNVYNSSGTLVAYGDAGGPASAYKDTESTFAPALQIGYFKHFDNSDHLWGTKLSYVYADHTSNNQKVDVPQYGSFTKVSGSETFTGNALVGSAQTTLKHQINLIPFIGKSFENSYVYFGAGPALFNIQSKVNNLYCFANIDGTPTDIAGDPINFSKSKWVWGGVAQLGASYYIDSTWAVDFNYNYAVSQRYSNNFSAAFSNPSGSNTTSGTAYASTSQKVAIQGIMISLNSHF